METPAFTLSSVGAELGYSVLTGEFTTSDWARRYLFLVTYCYSTARHAKTLRGFPGSGFLRHGTSRRGSPGFGRAIKTIRSWHRGTRKKLGLTKSKTC